MQIPSKFDAIRPYEPNELPAAYERMLAEPQFRASLAYIYPGLPFESLAERIRSCKTAMDFQETIGMLFLDKLIEKTSKGVDIDITNIDKTKRYTFVSNHRDIVLDASLLDKLLIDNGFTTTCQIAIGDNLLSLPWVRDLVRANKSFIVERGLPPREMLASSKRLSEYIHFAINEQHDNIWIAQREGRAKDSDDRTQEALLKMMAMGEEGSVIDNLVQLHIVPLAISYEFDPCDYLKAREFQLRRDVPGWEKGKDDDVISMRTGIVGYKGHIHYHCAPCVDGFLGSLGDTLQKGKLYTQIAAFIDRNIHKNYRLYPCNYIALDMLRGTRQHKGEYTQADKDFFEGYLACQLGKIDIKDKDENYLRERILTMYANPAINYLAAR